MQGGEFFHVEGDTGRLVAERKKLVGRKGWLMGQESRRMGGDPTKEKDLGVSINHAWGGRK